MVSSTNPFITKGGRDLYESSGWTYYLLNVFLWVYALLVIFWVILLLLVNIPHTYFWNLLQPGTLLSLRYRSLLSIVLILSALRFFVPIFARALLRFKRSRECSWAWLVLLGMIASVDLFVFLFLATQFSSANQPGDYYNVCNDAAYCCVHWMDTNCPRTGPCTDPAFVQSQLQRNGLCQALFYTSIPFLVLSMTLFLWPFILWVFPPTRISRLEPLQQKVVYKQERPVPITKRAQFTSVRHRKPVTITPRPVFTSTTKNK